MTIATTILTCATLGAFMAGCFIWACRATAGRVVLYLLGTLIFALQLTGPVAILLALVLLTGAGAAEHAGRQWVSERG